jgi:Domain of unknown function (DUF4760)
MNLNWSGRRTLELFIGITVGALGIWVGVLLLVWLVAGGGDGTSSGPWAMIEALSTALAAALVLSAGIFAYRELNEVASSRHLEVADRLFEELNSPENIEARRWVFQNLNKEPETGLATLSHEGRDNIKRVLNSLDRVAFLTQSGWIPDELVMPWMNPMVVKVWEKLGPYVEYESVRRNEPDYYFQARALAKRCRLWRQTHLPEAMITWVEDAL